MNSPQALYEIFKSHSNKRDAQWIVTVKGLFPARERMEQIAAKKPGSYFLFCSSTCTVVEETNSSDAPQRSRVSAKLYGATGQLFGTVRHFDSLPIRLTDEVASALDDVGPLIADAPFRKKNEL